MSIIFGCQTFTLRVLGSICLMFGQFQPGIAYKSVAYKKKHVVKCIAEKLPHVKAFVCYFLTNFYFFIKYYRINYQTSQLRRITHCQRQILDRQIKTWRQIVGTRSCLLKVMSLWAIILHKTDFAIFIVLLCVTS